LTHVAQYRNEGGREAAKMGRITAISLTSLSALLLAVVWVQPAVGLCPPTCGVGIVVDTTVYPGAADGLCSLDEAINATNGNIIADGCDASQSDAGATDTIAFNIPGGGSAPLIHVTTGQLPTITDRLTINGLGGGTQTKIEVRGPGPDPATGGKNGFTITGTGVTIQNMVINSFQDDGIYSNGAGTRVMGNIIGMDAAGTSQMPNAGFGVQIKNSGALIGGATDGNDCSGTCNLISGNKKSGILLDTTSTNAVVKGNFLGPRINGTVSGSDVLTNGIDVMGAGHRIGGVNGTTPGGACTGDCNVISGALTGRGISIAAAATSISVVGNFLGVDVAGTSLLINNFDIVSDSGSVTIGDGTPAGRNVISGAAYGIYMTGTSSGPLIKGNYIGTDTTGLVAIPNNIAGVALLGEGATVGGDEAGERNVISGNSYGVYADGSSSLANLVRGNYIGLAADGSSLANSNVGVIIQGGSSGNSVLENTIKNNGAEGVRTFGQGTNGNTISRNSIDDNLGLGIRIDNTTAEVSAPSISSAQNVMVDVSEATTVDGALQVIPNSPYSLEFFYSPACDSSGFGEGRTYIDSLIVQSAATQATFEFALSPAAPAGYVVTATATDDGGSTSEFSNCAEVQGTPTPTPSPSPTPTGAPSITPTSSATETGSPTPSATPLATPTSTFSGNLVQGDVNCSGVVDIEDFKLLIRFAAGLADGITPGACPDIGGALPAGGIPEKWGDVNCSGAVDALDALAVLAWPDFELPHPECEDIGHVVG
jgi:hypothetical protein